MQPGNILLSDVEALLPGAVLIVDAEDKIIRADPKGWSLIGCQDTSDGVPLAWVLAEPDARVEKYLQMCRRTREWVPTMFSVERADGNRVCYNVRGASPKSGTHGEVCLYFEKQTTFNHSRRFKVLNESIDKLRLEVKVRQRIEAVLEAEKQTLASVFQDQSLVDALGILANAVEKHSDGMLVSILLVDEKNCLRHAVAPSLPDDYVDAIDGVSVGPDVGSCGTAAYTGEIVIASDVTTDHRWADFRETAANAGLRACWSSPIKASDNTILGTLAMYFRTPRTPTDHELSLIANSAYVASVAIERFRSQELLKEMLSKEQAGREEAEARNRAKDNFLAMLGHELRNPLGAITNAALAIEKGNGAGHAANSLLKIILGESRLLKRILDDLLDISRLSRGKLQLKMELFSVDEFVAQLISAMRATYPGRHIAFEVDDNLGIICADRSRVTQSVHNLVDNAVKYSNPGDDITVRVDADSHCMRLTVTDSGQGIEPAILGSIFDPFVQSEDTIDRGNSGLGLGLALVERFAVMHGGNVSVNSAGKGLGSRFTLTIPRGDVCNETLSSDEMRGPADASPKKILVVEDNANAREGLCQLLQLMGHEVLSAGDGKAALNIIADSRPDVAFVDIGLPVIDGYEVARTVRDNPGASAIELVALTGYGQASDRKRALEAGFDTHLVKPADIEDLVRILGTPIA